MLTNLLKDIHMETYDQQEDYISEQQFIERILEKMYQFLNKKGQSIHTIGIGILRGNTFDMYYKGRLLKKFTQRFGAMSYETTIVGKACDLYKYHNKSYLNLYSKKEIDNFFTTTSKELRQDGYEDESISLKNRGKITIDQGIGSFLLIPLTYNKKIIGILTLSSMKEADETHIMDMDIKKNILPVANMLSLLLYMEKISYEKAQDIGKLLISSVDAKDEYQSSHSLNVKTVIDFFIHELSKDKELRERAENTGLILTVDRIERLRLAALLHDVGKIFIPGSILRKSDLTKEEILIRKMHSYCTYNILANSKTLKDIADIASTHHAFYYLPCDTSDLDEYSQIETKVIGYPFDRISQQSFSPETQIIALADVLNAIVRTRPNGKGLSLSQAIEIIENEEYKFHDGLKDIFLTIVKRVEDNINEEKYLPEQAEAYRSCLWLDKPIKDKKLEKKEWATLLEFFEHVEFNTMGIFSIINTADINQASKTIETVEEKPIYIKEIGQKYTIVSIRDIPKEEGIIWINKMYESFNNQLQTDKIAFAFIGKSGFNIDISELYSSLKEGLDTIQNEPVQYYLYPMICTCI